VAALLGIAVASALWWSYFDWVIFIGQARLARRRVRIGRRSQRDLYSYLHLPMVAGIIAVRARHEDDAGRRGEPAADHPAVGLCGGLALYFLAHVALRLRVGADWGTAGCRDDPADRLIPLANVVPALTALGWSRLCAPIRPPTRSRRATWARK